MSQRIMMSTDSMSINPFEFCSQAQTAGLPSAYMRFRAKFGLIGWCVVFITCFNVFDSLSIKHSFSSWGVGDTFLAILALQWTLIKTLTYWKMGAGSLHERRLWNAKDIDWQEVTHVGASDSEHPDSGYVTIDYARPSPMSDRGRILADPADRALFLATLHKFAPQAEFDV
jgi:hypothetical protein